MKTIIAAFGEKENSETNGLLKGMKDNRNLNINKIEKVIGYGNSGKGAEKIKEVLQNFTDFGYSPATVGRIIGKERHVIYSWYRRYNLKYLSDSGDKPSLLKISFSKNENHNKLPRLEKIDGKLHKVYYIYPNDVFAYFIGVILGDGSIDSREIYIAGGLPYNFLDNLCGKAQKLSKYLGNITIKVKYFDSKDNEIHRSDSNISFWRLYIYCSALAHSLKNKNILRETLDRIWSSSKLLNSFTAGLFDADGYLVHRKGKPETIGLGQTVDKWWFPLLSERLKKEFLIKCSKRTRPYEIKNRGKIYTGISKSFIIEWYMSSWPKFINKVILPFCINPDKLGRAHSFKMHAIKMKNRLRVI